MKKTLVVGVSLKLNRYSNLAVRRLVEHNITTEAFGLKTGEVSGVQVKTNFNDFQDIHTITLYIGKKHQSEYYAKILKLRPERVIFNPGTENPDFYNKLTSNGIHVEESCTLVLLATGQF
ncbi:MAG: CoA-binding protein [Bacteroidota bacterium]